MEGVCLFYRVICFLEISVLSWFVWKSKLQYTVKYTHTDNTWTSGSCKHWKKHRDIVIFNQVNSFSTGREIGPCTRSVIFLGCRLCMRFCMAITCSSTVVRKNKVTIKEELSKNLTPHRVTELKPYLAYMHVDCHLLKQTNAWLIN